MPAIETDVDVHFEITQQNVRDIGEIRTDVAGLKVGVEGITSQQREGFTQVGNQMTTLSAQIAQLNAPKQWPSVAGLFLTGVVIFGGIFSFMMVSQSEGTTKSLEDMRRESDQRYAQTLDIIKTEAEFTASRFGGHITSERISYEKFFEVFSDFAKNTDDRFRTDDLREQSDAFDNGYSKARFEELRNQFNQLDAELLDKHRILEENLMDFTHRLAIAESGVSNLNQYARDHISKAGNTGHPKENHRVLEIDRRTERESL